ncbi:ankyrin repeat-containing domain protein [Aspergillus pseudoustus]|uniref:Ankyrin repeat-containing domain protein n=1 Tax=Aspergillus pseudoustus TaxID=1810923 RepID=A0ABR4JVB1_9EURO
MWLCMLFPNYNLKPPGKSIQGMHALHLSIKQNIKRLKKKETKIMPLLDLPNELLATVADYLDSDRDINALTQTTPHLYALLNSHLYKHHVRQHQQRPEKNCCPALLWAARANHPATATRLITHGANANSHDGDWNISALLLAARSGSQRIVELLLANGAKPDLANGDGETPLMEAAGRGHEGIVRLLLLDAGGGGADPTVRDRQGFTAAAWAARGGQLGALKILLDRDRDTDSDTGPAKNLEEAQQCRRDGETALLFHAAEGGDEAVITFLLDRGCARVRARCLDSDGEGVLSCAARSRRTGAFRLLLDRGADPEMMDENGRAAAWWVAAGGSKEMVRMLLERRVGGLDRRDRYGETPLAAAAQSGRLSILRVLAAEGADVDSQCRAGQTPLAGAASNDQARAVRLLLRLGADPELRDEDGRSPLHLATQGGYAKGVRALLKHGRGRVDPNGLDGRGLPPLSLAVNNGSEEIARLLLRGGASPEIRDNGGRTHLSNAAGFGYGGVFKTLLDARVVDIEARDDAGLTPLAHATRQRRRAVWEDQGCDHQEILEILLKKGARIDAQDNEGRTPLSHAGGQGHVQAVESLLEHGALVDSRDNLGRTPLSYSAERGTTPSIVQLLLKHGADANVQDHDGRTPLSIAADRDPDAADAMLAMLTKLNCSSR